MNERLAKRVAYAFNNSTITPTITLFTTYANWVMHYISRIFLAFGVLGSLVSTQGVASEFAVAQGQWHISYQRSGKLAFFTYSKKGEKTTCLTGDFRTIVKARVSEAGCQINSENIDNNSYHLTGSCYLKQLDTSVNVIVNAVALNSSTFTIKMATAPGSSLYYVDNSLVKHVGPNCLKHKS